MGRSKKRFRSWRTPVDHEWVALFVAQTKAPDKKALAGSCLHESKAGLRAEMIQSYQPRTQRADFHVPLQGLLQYTRPVSPAGDESMSGQCAKLLRTLGDCLQSVVVRIEHCRVRQSCLGAGEGEELLDEWMGGYGGVGHSGLRK